MCVTPESKLSPRAYAILGLLAIRDWTTYELAGQMERGVGDIWTAARSMVYSEPKRLAELGLVRARTEAAGRRTRTWYSITPAGLAELRGWLAEPGAPPAMQFEGLLKVLLADASEPQTINASLTEAIKWADELQGIGRVVAAEYSAGRGPFQERAQLVALAFAFLWDYAEFVRRWATWAQQRDSFEPHENVFRQALAGGPVLPPGLRRRTRWRCRRTSLRPGCGRRRPSRPRPGRCPGAGGCGRPNQAG
jgi:DNA-binding PadR family transcriptional regulator